MFLVSIFKANTRAADIGPLTPMEFEILLSLADGDRHGYAIMQDVEARSNGTVTVRPGTLYRAISRVLESGLIVEVAATPARARGVDDERRRYYTLTPLGRRAGGAEARRLERQVDAARARKLLKPEA